MYRFFGVLVLIFLELCFFYYYIFLDVRCDNLNLMTLCLSFFVFLVHVVFVFIVFFKVWWLYDMSNLFYKFGPFIFFGWGIAAFPFAFRIFIYACSGK